MKYLIIFLLATVLVATQAKPDRRKKHNGMPERVAALEDIVDEIVDQFQQMMEMKEIMKEKVMEMMMEMKAKVFERFEALEGMVTQSESKFTDLDARTAALEQKLNECAACNSAPQCPNPADGPFQVQRVPKVAGEYLGCFQDTLKDRMFRGYVKRNKAMTKEQCLETCRAGRFVYAGLQAGQWCMCGNTFPQPISNPKLPDASCNVACTGDSTQICGAGMIMSVFSTGIEQYTFDATGMQVGESFIQASPNRYYAYTDANSNNMDP